ncbi:endonuclease/exonuclease/phosphatase family protein [Roseibacillus persicicus]|uniref:endonuclease/exonuclease/phosphatase family protein n=1 Tax=Roseibacillus persicicus TaxID=454148 RepID=UPI00398AB365
MVRPLFLVLLLATGAFSVPLRVVTFNIETNRDSNDSVTEALNEPGTADYNSVRDILLRINADVVCLQELANPDVSNGTNGNTNSDVHSLASDLGLPYVIIPTSSGVLDFGLRNAILSRYPFESVDEIGTGDYMETIGSVGSNGSRAKDVTRAMPAITIDIPGAAKPTTIVTLHNKAGSTQKDSFRQCVEMERLAQYLNNNLLNETDNIVVLGDFNFSRSNDLTYTSEPADLPSTWNRGTEIPLPLTYSQDPDFYLPTPWQLTAIDARAVNGNDVTTQGGSNLDYILTTPAIAEVGSEIYRSTLDSSNSLGLSKVGDPLPSETSGIASDHYAVFADLEIEDLFTAYSLTDAEPKMVETFDGFSGNFPPAAWTSAGADWAGLYQSGDGPALYAFDSAGDRSVGLIGGQNTATFTASYTNDTSAPIEALELNYLIRQFTNNDPGTSDTLTASLSIDGGSTIPLPDLTFTATPSTTLPFSQTLSTTLGGLSIPAGSTFTLTLTATKGTPIEGTAPDEAFINEFHYDNVGTDQDEFIEVVVSSGFTGALSGLVVELYNQNGTNYGSHPLTSFDNFASPSFSNGYQIFSKALPSSDLQNGGNDGLALVSDGSVLQFISYEGTTTATNGSAISLTSMDIGVSQSTSNPIGTDSLGLTGTGAAYVDFTWTEFQGSPFSPGAANPGQTFDSTASSLPQAFSFDNVTVCIAEPPDNDSDGDPDSSDPDDDNDFLPDLVEAELGTNPFLADSDGNGTPDADEDFDGDGQTNGEEVLVTLTDPADANSLFVACLQTHPNNAGQLELSFPTLLGRAYRIRSGDDLTSLQILATYTGTGETFSYLVSPNQSQPTFFTVEASLAN